MSVTADNKALLPKYLTIGVVAALAACSSAVRADDAGISPLSISGDAVARGEYLTRARRPCLPATRAMTRG